VLLAGLSTGNKIGLAVVAAVFIGFALVSSFVAPRRYPDFPGKNGLSVFILASVACFAAMLTAVVVFGVESEAEGGTAAESGKAKHAIAVVETEFAVKLKQAKEAPGEYTLDVANQGKIEHDLAVEGPGLKGETKTALIKPGGTAKLTVPLEAGTYTLYCTVTGHREAGMVTKLTVG
jgi:uncharacterized cupredoxin-like copper-binding protein